MSPFLGSRVLDVDEPGCGYGSWMWMWGILQAFTSHGSWMWMWMWGILWARSHEHADTIWGRMWHQDGMGMLGVHHEGVQTQCVRGSGLPCDYNVHGSGLPCDYNVHGRGIPCARQGHTMCTSGA